MDALLAPIALYPDELLSQVLMASTYPLEVVEAARFVQQNPGLKGQALDNALQDKTWDPSVQSLTAFPQVLAMMSDKLDWTQQLGDAFLANQGQAMDTVQRLRARAQAAGNLKNTPQQRVLVQQQNIVIEPAQPDYVYVPVYNPTIVYGPWWAPAYRPWFWYPPPIYGYPAIGGVIAAGIIFGSAWVITSNHWGWARPVWGSRSIAVNVDNNRLFDRPQFRDRYHDGNWQHMPEHRRGVAYRDPGVRGRYQQYDSRAVDARRDFRGNDRVRPGGNWPTAGQYRTDRPGAGGAGSREARQQVQPGREANFNRPAGGQNATRPSPNGQRPTASSSQTSSVVNQRDARAQVQQQSNRGQMSRESLTRSGGAGERPAGAERSGGERGGARAGGGERSSGGGKPGGEGGRGQREQGR